MVSGIFEKNKNWNLGPTSGLPEFLVEGTLMFPKWMFILRSKIPKNVKKCWTCWKLFFVFFFRNCPELLDIWTKWQSGGWSSERSRYREKHTILDFRWLRGFRGNKEKRHIQDFLGIQSYSRQSGKTSNSRFWRNSGSSKNSRKIEKIWFWRNSRD